MKPSLDVDVRRLLEASRGSWLSIAAKAGVSYSWISKFVNGRIPNPGYATLCRLLELLSEPSIAPEFSPEVSKARAAASPEEI